MRNDCKNYSQTQLSFLPPLSCVMSLCKSWNAQRLVHLFQSRIILSQPTIGPQCVSPQRLLPKLSVHHGRQLSFYGPGLHVSLHPTTQESKPPPVIPHSSALSGLNASSNQILRLIILMSSVMFPGKICLYRLGLTKGIKSYPLRTITHLGYHLALQQHIFLSLRQVNHL